jgi:hypothetical protein
MCEIILLIKLCQCYPVKLGYIVMHADDAFF